MDFKKRDLLFFLSGAGALHTLSHIMLGLSNTLPLQFFFITLDCKFNLSIVLVSAAITIWLFAWALKTK